MTGSDRGQLAAMSHKAKAAMGVDALEVLADRGYFSGEEILACEAIGVTPIVPKPHTSGARADGRFGKQDFVYVAEQDAYRCPAGQLLPHHMTTVEKGLTLHRHWDRSSCQACRLGEGTMSRLPRRRAISQSLADLAARSEEGGLRRCYSRIKATLCARVVVAGHRSLSGLRGPSRSALAKARRVRRRPAPCGLAQAVLVTRKATQCR
jgi:hypothetical protein